MGKVVFEDPIEHISGKISKKFRTCYNFRRASKRKYTSVRGDRTTPVGENELAIRNKFRVVRLAAQERAMDLSKVSADQEVFIAERKVEGFKYTTYKGWLFAKAYKYYDEQTGTVQWPSSLAE